VLHFWPTYSHTHTHPLAKGEIQTIQKAQKWANSECRATEKKDRKQGGKIEKTAPLQSLSAEREKGVEGGSMGGEGADWMGALM